MPRYLALLLAIWMTASATGCGKRGTYQKAHPRRIHTDTRGNVVVTGYTLSGSTSPLPVHARQNPYSDSTVRQFVLLSSDGGDTWSTALRETCGAAMDYFAPILDGLVFACQSIGIFHSSTPVSDSWHPGGVLDLGSYDYVNNVFAAGVEDSSGNHYAIGNARQSSDPQSPSHLLVWRKESGSDEWNLVQDYLPADASTTTFGRDIAATSDGALFVAASSIRTVESGGTLVKDYDWLVFKSTDQGASFSIVDQFDHVAGTSTMISKITVDPSGNLYALGTSNTAEAAKWIVRKSSNGGATWTTVDDFALDPPDESVPPSAFPYGIATGADGTVYTVGTSRTDSGHFAWIVRKSSDGGSTWSIVDQYSVDPYSPQARSVTVGPQGEVYVLGHYTPSDDSSANPYRPVHIKIRKSADGGASWTELYSGGIP